MPIPFILGGLALAAGAYGAKKGIDAKGDYDTAKKYNRWAQELYDEAKQKLDDKREDTNNSLEQLGKLKVSIYDGSLMDFVNTFQKIKNIDFENNVNQGILKNIDKQTILDIKKTVLEMQEVLGGGITALGSGALAGFGALGGVGMLASASTGTAIASLSGAAATNATLAWLGGGALSAGGFGMAGGMAVLGGIVAGPVLAVGGMMLASKAEDARDTAYGNYDKAKVAAEQMDSAGVVLDGIQKRTDEFEYILKLLNKTFEEYLNILKFIVDNKTNYQEYQDNEKQIVLITFSIAQTIKNICDAPIIDKDGKVTQKSQEVLKSTNEFMNKLKEI